MRKRRVRRLHAALGCLLLAFALPGLARAETRIALVIGNGAYKSAKLANPVADAELMATTLAGVGFTVTRLTDVDQKAMKRAIMEFGRQLRAGDAIGLFYFAGHGVQVDGENYLVPVDAEIADEKEVPIEAVSVSELLRTMERSDARVNIAVLDACRNNPFARGMRGGARGLASVDAPAGTLVAYATAPGQLALDGDNGHSPYSAALASVMAEAGLPIEEVFKRTRARVREVTESKQTPWESSSLTGSFYFKDRPVAVAEAAGRGPDPTEGARLAELKAWDAIKTSTDPAAFIRHLEHYPDGVFADLARLKAMPGKAAGKAQVTAQRGGEPPHDAEGLYTAALRLDAGDGTPEDPVGAARLFEQAAELGHVNAMVRLGELREQGRGVPTDPAAAARLYKRAGALGSARALTRLAAMSLDGHGVAQDNHEAAALYRQAAALGSPAAAYALARMLDKGIGMPRQLGEAAKFYGHAADKGHPQAMSALATMLEFGEGIDKDVPLAVTWYHKAAEAGDAAGMTGLGYLYALGKGVPRDVAEAERWYRAAARLGSARAEFNLALLILRGEGIKRDVPAAVALLTAAAGQGHAGAMRELGLLFEEGRIVSAEPQKAAELLLSAAQHGSRLARDDLTQRAGALRSATVKELQQRLIAGGAIQGTPSGHMDAATRTAIETYVAAPERSGPPAAAPGHADKPAGSRFNPFARWTQARRADAERQGSGTAHGSPR